MIRWVIYDYDVDQLLTTKLYEERLAAQHDAGEVDNTIVLALQVPGRLELSYATEED